MKYEWKVTEWWFSQGYGSAQKEIDEMAAQGFERFGTLPEKSTGSHYNVYRKLINDKNENGFT